MSNHSDIDLSGTWTGMKGDRLATLKDLQLDHGSDGSPRVSYIFRLGGQQTGMDGGAGCSDLSNFIGPNARYTKVN